MKKFLHSFVFFNLMALISFSQSAIPAEANDISPLLIGERVPDVTLSDVSGKKHNLRELTSQTPSVVVFYRGGWCPYCNLHLAELQAIEAEVIRAGYQIIAISPDSPESMRGSVSKNKLNYLLLSDSDTQALTAFGLAFQAPKNYSEILNKASGSQNKSVLPVPAVFVLNNEGEIVFEHINPDYKKRLKGSLLLAILRELK